MEQNYRNEELEIDLKELFFIIWRKVVIILLVGLVAALAAFLYTSYVVDPIYESKTRIYVMNNNQDNTSVTYSDLQTGSQLTKDFRELVVSRPVLEEVISVLNLDYAPNQLMRKITVTTPADTRILQIAVTDTDPFVAKQIADAVRDAAGDKIKSVMEIERLNVVEDGSLPNTPISPNKRLYTMIAGLLGLMLATGVVILRHMLDDTVKTPDDIEKYLNVSVLGMIPYIDENDSTSSKKKKKDKKSKKRRG